MTEVISRKESIEQGLTRYFTGTPCKHGHISPRKVGSGQCAECSRLISARWAKEGRVTSKADGGKELPSLVFLKETFEYHEDGYLIWKVRPREHFDTTKGWKMFNTRFAGNEAGYLNKRNGYITVNLNGTYYKGHRLIYKLVTGAEPKLPIDHIDGDVTNNKISNLREATVQENCFNTVKRVSKDKATSKYKGVGLLESGKWIAYVIKKPYKYIEKFNTEIEAALWYDKKAVELFGEFALTNFTQEVEK